ncbi:MAG: P-type DNA transfer ATPase VirB11 [Phenylobacterium sp.]|nr:P-type DNA transfer ATPase VirB11 [Phenylobacterium sp.]MDP3749257.1 P-type DNA transfer ATPase VirB11 [Phenylobacterium sp.]
MTDGAYLDAYLQPLVPYLDRPEVTDLFINRPGELWVETLGGEIERHVEPTLDDAHLWRLARQVAARAHQGVSRAHPLLSATLPDGSRVQVIAPPATRGHLALAIRRHVVADLSLGDLQRSGVFDWVGRADGRRSTRDADLQRLLAGGDTEAFLRAAVLDRRNIVVCGGTSTGKTTFANALISEIPRDERLIVIEDAPELQIHHPNAVGLVAVRGELGEAAVDVDDLLRASLRMRPDRIILGELRGSEALTFARAANTGHPGSITTVHADSPAGGLSQMALMMVQADSNLTRDDSMSYVREVVDVWVQLRREAGRRLVTEILFEPRS